MQLSRRTMKKLYHTETRDYKLQAQLIDSMALKATAISYELLGFKAEGPIIESCPGPNFVFMKGRRD